jgi:hypothetical protein
MPAGANPVNGMTAVSWPRGSIFETNRMGVGNVGRTLGAQIALSGCASAAAAKRVAAARRTAILDARLRMSLVSVASLEGSVAS